MAISSLPAAAGTIEVSIFEVAKTIVVYSREPPFAVDAMVFEEDTSLVLSASPVIRESREHPIRLMTSLYEYKDRELGS